MPTTHQCERIVVGYILPKKITETEPLTRHKSNNLVYDGTFYQIDNIIKMLTKKQDAILFQMQSRSHL